MPNEDANGAGNGTIPEVPHEDYQPSCILVTGGAGFIASHVAIRLVKNYGHYKVCLPVKCHPRIGSFISGTEIVHCDG